MPKIAIVDKIHSDGIKLLENRPNFQFEIIEDLSKKNLITKLPSFDGITLRRGKIDSEILEKCKNLKVISRHGVGYDNIDIKFLKKNNITLLITATTNSISPAEHVMFMILNISKGIDLYDTAVRKGEFENITVKSIHVKRVPVLSVVADKYVCLAVKIKPEIKNLLRHGQVIVNKDNNIQGIYEFSAEVNIIKTHSTSIKVGYEPVIHTRNIRQTCKIMKIEGKKCARKINNDQILRTGDSAIIKFKFKFRPEYIKEGYNLLFCEGRVKAVGKIISVS